MPRSRRMRTLFPKEGTGLWLRLNIQGCTHHCRARSKPFKSCQIVRKCGCPDLPWHCRRSPSTNKSGAGWSPGAAPTSCKGGGIKSFRSMGSVSFIKAQVGRQGLKLKYGTLTNTHSASTSADSEGFSSVETATAASAAVALGSLCRRRMVICSDNSIEL